MKFQFPGDNCNELIAKIATAMDFFVCFGIKRVFG